MAGLLVLLGIGVGVFGTLVGAGGGFVLTPILLLLYPTDSPASITAISLVVVFFNALSGSVAYARLRRIDYRSGVAFSIATMPGAIAGALLVAIAPRRLFDVLTAALLGGLAAWVVSGARTSRAASTSTGGQLRELTDRSGAVYRYSVPMARGAGFSVMVGFVSSFLGIGGGVIHVPLMIGALGFPVHVATATSHFVLANMAAVGTVTHYVHGSFAGGIGIHRALALSVGVVVGAQGGAALSQHLHGTAIQWMLAFALAGLSIRILLAAL